MLKPDKLAPYKRLFLPNKLLKHAFGPLDTESIRLVRKMVAGCKQEFVQWAVRAILNWNNKEKPAKLLQIHGDLDKIFPAGNARSVFILREGGIYVYTHGAVIRSLIVNNCLITTIPGGL